MEQSTLNLLSAYMPMAQRYRSQFSSLNTLLSKTTLTGKISSLDIAANLFDYMEQTQEKFENLQEKLINTIIEQSFLNLFEEAQTSSKIFSEMLSAFLQSRYGEILAFSKSRYILEQCANAQAQETIFEYLREFANHSSVYKDILLFDDKGNLLKSLLTKVQNKTNLSAILEANSLESFGDFYSKVDFYSQNDFQEERQEFFFVLPLREEEGRPMRFAAVFVLDFQSIFEWLNRHFAYRLPQASLVIVNQRNVILFSNNPKNFVIGQTLKVNACGDYNFTEFRSKACLLSQNEIAPMPIGNLVENWKVCRILPLYVAFDVKQQNKQKIDAEMLKDSLLITDELDSVIAEGENINEELGDAVINGEIIASKSHSYTLNPILNNIRILSEEMNTLCVQSTEELQRGIYGALFNIVNYYSKYAVTLMDNWVKESVDEIGWIKNIPEFSNFILSKNENKHSAFKKENLQLFLKNLSESLKKYHNIFLFDREGNILVDALDEVKIDNNQKTNLIERFENGSLNAGIVPSNYEQTSLYNNNSTIIFYTGIKDGARVVGGLAFVLDIQKIVELIQNIIPQDSPIISEKSEIFVALFDNNRNILASTNPEFSFEKYELNEKIDFKNIKDSEQIIQIGQKHYLLRMEACPNSKGGFIECTKKMLYSMVLVALKEEVLEV